MSCQTLVLIFSLMKVLTLANNNCSDIVLKSTSGTIKFETQPNENVSCHWTIIPPENSITSLKVNTFNFANCQGIYSCCLSIGSSHHEYLTLCNQKQEKSISFSARENNIAVDLNCNCGGSTNLWIEFTTRTETECPNSDFQCLDKSSCYNTSEICGYKFACNDHSDSLGCGMCDDTSSPCNYDSEFCFKPSQRCDRVLNCPTGEDEINCTILCPQFKCPLEEKCLTKEQVCDRNRDCSNGFDEENCIIEMNAPKIVIISSMLILCTVCCIIFICLIFRWIITRRDVNRYLQNLPEFPLAPFQGPGEEDSESSSNDALDADFLVGGEVYEHYMQALKKKNKSSKAIQVGGITAKYSHLELNGENEFIVLASLNVPTELCIGLTISDQSSARDSIATLKSICNSRGSSSSSGQGSTKISDTKKWKSKSCTDHQEFLPSAGTMQGPSSARSSVLRKPPTNSEASMIINISSWQENSKSIICFGGGDCQIDSTRTSKKISSVEFPIVEKQEMLSENDHTDFLEKSKSNPEKLEPILKKNSAPLPCIGKYETPKRISRSISSIGKNNNDHGEILQLNRFEIASDSSQWTDLDDVSNKVILVKSVAEKTKLSKRSSRKKNYYSDNQKKLK